MTRLDSSLSLRLCLRLLLPSLTTTSFAFLRLSSSLVVPHLRLLPSSRLPRLSPLRHSLTPRSTPISPSSHALLPLGDKTERVDLPKGTARFPAAICSLSRTATYNRGQTKTSSLNSRGLVHRFVPGIRHILCHRRLLLYISRSDRCSIEPSHRTIVVASRQPSSS